MRRKFHRMLKSTRIRLWLYSFLCILLTGCTIMPEELKTADGLIQTSPDSALHILQNISPQHYEYGSVRALYNLLLVSAMDKNRVLLTSDTLLDSSLNYYRSQDDYEHLSICYLYKGRMNKYIFQYEKAMDFYLKGLDAAQYKKDNLLLAKINSDLGDIYNYQNDYELSRQKYLLAYSYFSSVNFSDNSFYSLLNIGRTYYQTRDYKNAARYYNRIMTMAGDSLQTGDLYHSIGLNYYKQQQYDSALMYFRQVIHYPFIGNNRAIRYYFLADLFFELKQNDSAGYYAKKAIYLKPDIRTQRECYRILVNTVTLTGNLMALNRYMMRYQDCTDSIRKIDTQTKGSILESIHKINIEVEKTRTKSGYLVAFFFRGHYNWYTDVFTT